MTEDDLIRYFPQLYHMTADGAWPSIHRHGLLSTSALLDLLGKSGDERECLESEQRPRSIPLHGDQGAPVLRDQRPLNRGLLEKHLIGMIPEQWYRLLNSKVFFFPSLERLQGLLNGSQYRSEIHTVLTVDTRELVRRHRNRITLSRINTGAMLHGGSPRGVGTFRSIQGFPFEAGDKGPGGISAQLAEVAVSRAVPDIAELVVRVERRRGQDLVDVISEFPGGT